MLINKNSKTLIWDNIPEWAIYSLEYGIEEDLFLTDEDKKLITKFIGEILPKRICHVSGLGIIQGVRPFSCIRKTVQDLYGQVL